MVEAFATTLLTPKTPTIVRTRSMGQGFTDALASNGPGESSVRLDYEKSEEFDADPSEDPVRMYLMQMGQIPLLTRIQEVASAKHIERTRLRYRHTMLATDFMLSASLHLLEQVRDKKAAARPNDRSFGHQRGGEKKRSCGGSCPTV